MPLGTNELMQFQLMKDAFIVQLTGTILNCNIYEISRNLRYDLNKLRIKYIKIQGMFEK